MRKVHRSITKPPHCGRVEIPSQAETVWKRRRRKVRFLELIAGEKGAGAAVLESRRVCWRPPAGLRRERQTALRLHLTGPAGCVDNSNWVPLTWAPE